MEANPKSAVSAYIMQLHYTDLSLAQLQHYYDRLGFALQGTPPGKAIQNQIVKLRGGSPGSMAKAFATVDLNGKPLSLSDYRGKFLLIDFWASWCVPCRQGNPHLKELYAKYRSRGFEILGVSDDDHAEAAWRQAVAKDEIAMWKHVLRGFTGKAGDDGDINEKFAISTLPTKILINPEGKIIARYASEEAALDQKLAEVFK